MKTPAQPPPLDALEEAGDVVPDQHRGVATVGVARAMVLLGIDGGLRRGEILALRWDDVDLKRRLVTVRRTVVRVEVSETTKSRTESTVGLTRRLAAALRAIRHDRAAYVLVNRRGNHWSEQRIRKVLRRLVKRAGIRWLGTHVLRRTCATRIADNGGRVNAVAAQLRHSGLQMASRYVDRRSGAARRACEALERSWRRAGAHLQPP